MQDHIEPLNSFLDGSINNLKRNSILSPQMKNFDFEINYNRSQQVFHRRKVKDRLIILLSDGWHICPLIMLYSMSWCRYIWCLDQSRRLHLRNRASISHKYDCRLIGTGTKNYSSIHHAHWLTNTVIEWHVEDFVATCAMPGITNFQFYRKLRPICHNPNFAIWPFWQPAPLKICVKSSTTIC